MNKWNLRRIDSINGSTVASFDFSAYNNNNNLTYLKVYYDQINKYTGSTHKQANAL